MEKDYIKSSLTKDMLEILKIETTGDVILPNGFQVGNKKYKFTALEQSKRKYNGKILDEAIGTFEECDELTSITLPEGIETIGDCAFANCENLTNITLPESLISIGYFAFGNCKNLTNITIPKNVTNITVYAFQNCTSLKEVNWQSPDYITKDMLKYIFFNCPALETLNYHGRKIELKKNIDEIIKDASIIPPDEKVSNLNNIIKVTQDQSL